TGAALAVLLAFLHAAVAGEEAAVAQGGLGGWVVFHDRPGQAHDNRAALAGGAPALTVDPDVKLAGDTGRFQRGKDRLAIGLAAEVVVQFAVVDGDLARTGRDTDAGDAGLAPAGAENKALGAGRFRRRLGSRNNRGNGRIDAGGGFAHGWVLPFSSVLSPRRWGVLFRNA